MIRKAKGLTLCAALGLVVVACGSPEDEKKAPPIVANGHGDVHALEAGDYYVTEVRAPEDGCGKQIFRPDRPLTAVRFILANDGHGGVALDFCNYEGRSLSGTVRGNTGSLSVVHQNRHVESEGATAIFDQECHMDLTVTADNTFTGRYSEQQRNRNAALRKATVDLAECTTSFAFTMQRR